MQERLHLGQLFPNRTLLINGCHSEPNEIPGYYSLGNALVLELE